MVVFPLIARFFSSGTHFMHARRSEDETSSGERGVCATNNMHQTSVSRGVSNSERTLCTVPVGGVEAQTVSYRSAKSCAAIV